MRGDGLFGESPTKDDLIAERRNVGLVAHQLHVPRTIGDAAVEDAADDFIVTQNHLLVEAALGVVQRDLLIGLVGGSERTRREHVNAGYLEAGEDRRRHVDSVVSPASRAPHTFA